MIIRLIWWRPKSVVIVNKPKIKYQTELLPWSKSCKSQVDFCGTTNHEGLSWAELNQCGSWFDVIHHLVITWLDGAQYLMKKLGVQEDRMLKSLFYKGTQDSFRAIEGEWNFTETMKYFTTALVYVELLETHNLLIHKFVIPFCGK